MMSDNLFDNVKKSVDQAVDALKSDFEKVGEGVAMGNLQDVDSQDLASGVSCGKDQNSMAISQSGVAQVDSASVAKKGEKADKNEEKENSSGVLDKKVFAGVRFALAQAHFKVGDIAANVKKMRVLAEQARDEGVDVIVFPELALFGYPPEDLVFDSGLADQVKAALRQLGEVHGIVILVGYPHVDHYGRFNSVAILHNGQQKGFYHKRRLCRWLDEPRYFDQGHNQVLFDFKGITIGLLIGDDLLSDEIVAGLKQQGADMLVCLNASVFEVGKQRARKSLLARKAKSVGLPILAVNTVGGQDDLVFDGGSLAVQADGEVAHEAARFLEQLLVVGIADGQLDTQAKAPLYLSEESEIYQALVVGLRDYVLKSGFKGVIVGLSGGLDSALTLTIAVDALGSDKVYAVMMPYSYTSHASLEDAKAQAERLNVSYTVCPIHDAVEGFRHTLAPLLHSTHKQDNTEDNIQARVRGMILMAISNKFGHLVIGTGNKSEMATGDSVLYGDMIGGFDVLKDVYKSQIYKLAHYRNRLEDIPVIPERVIERPSSTELRPEEAEQDYPSNLIDAILIDYIDKRMSIDDLLKTDHDPKLVEKVVRLVNTYEYKRRQAPLGTKITPQAFGRDRHYPIIHSWLKRKFKDPKTND